MVLLAIALLVGPLTADEVASNGVPVKPIKQAVTFEPLFFQIKTAPTVGPINYHYSLWRHLSMSGLTRLGSRRGLGYRTFDWGLGLGADLWFFSDKAFAGLFIGRQIEATNIWVLSDGPTSCAGCSGSGFSLSQVYELGYQWSINHYLVGLKFIETDLGPPEAVSLSLGYSW